LSQRPDFPMTSLNFRGMLNLLFSRTHHYGKKIGLTILKYASKLLSVSLPGTKTQK